MSPADAASLDVVIFGGGTAGLWLLDELHRAGYRVLLLEAGELGAGQTVASQGIIHGGLKYSLGGLLTPSARAVREMPTLWRRCLAGERKPDLSSTRLRAEYCHLWQTGAISSRMAMIGARAGLRIRPVPLEAEARPELLRECPGIVARLDEQVIEPESFITTLADRHEDRILRIDVEHGVGFDCPAPGEVKRIHLINPQTGDPLNVKPRYVVLTAGVGSADLRASVGLESHRLQRRPLHMVVARGDLPLLNGHCVDRMHTRVTITSTRDYGGRSIWQIGGQIAEDGVALDEAALIRHARSELQAVLPGAELSSAGWATYRVDRAEVATRSGVRPAEARVLREGNIITGLPTKMVLAPQLAARLMQHLPAPAGLQTPAPEPLSDWPRPGVAVPPWEENLSWSTDD
jgi:glycerol-3-phosphate dehydrogenase